MASLFHSEAFPSRGFSLPIGNPSIFPVASGTGGYTRSLRPSADDLEAIMDVSSPMIGARGFGVPDALRRDILGLQRKPGWNGRGSRAIKKKDCEAALDFLSLVLARMPMLSDPRFGPSPRGGVPLTWRFGNTSLTLDIRYGAKEFVDFYQCDFDYNSESGTESWESAIDRLGSRWNAS